jgi:hypothetical protein
MGPSQKRDLIHEFDLSNFKPFCINILTVLKGNLWPILYDLGASLVASGYSAQTIKGCKSYLF